MYIFGVGFRSVGQMGPRERQALAQDYLGSKKGTKLHCPVLLAVFTSLSLSIGLALLAWLCCALYSLWPGREGWEGSGWETGAPCPRLEGGRSLVQTQSPFVCQHSKAAGVGFLGVFFLLLFLSFLP